VDAIVTDPPWNQLEKERSRLRPASKKAKSNSAVAIPVDDARAPDTDHLSDGDVAKHAELWYKILADDGMVLLRLSWVNVDKWADALKGAGFTLFPAPPHGHIESPCFHQVLSHKLCLSSPNFSPVCRLDPATAHGRATARTSGSSHARRSGQRGSLTAMVHAPGSQRQSTAIRRIHTCGPASRDRAHGPEPSCVAKQVGSRTVPRRCHFQ
jgi:hypothetical protein